MTNKVRVGSWYRFQAVGLDVYSPCHQGLKNGQVVKVIDKYGCPPANTMGHFYVETEDGQFMGLVSTGSLKPSGRKVK